MVMKVYPPEFKADAVALYLSDPARTITSVARDLGISRETLRLWVRQAQAAGTAGTPGSCSRKVWRQPRVGQIRGRIRTTTRTQRASTGTSATLRS